jgi:hypothetical protein
MSISTPFVAPFVSIRDFGAVSDDPSPTARAANSNAFAMAQAAMPSSPETFGHPIFIPSGAFYLADNLHISRSLELFGTGMRGESILMFPSGTSLIIDEGISAPTPSNGTDCIIRDLQIQSEEYWTKPENDPFDEDTFDPPSFEGTSKGTPGILQKARATIQRMYIGGFTGTGIYILADGGSSSPFRKYVISSGRLLGQCLLG